MSETTLTFKFRDEGALTDLDAIVLADATNAYGVRRQDTLGVVVAAGTAIPRISQGIYQYTFTDPAPDLIYDWVGKWTIASKSGYDPHIAYGGTSTSIGVPILSLSSVAAGNTYFSSRLFATAWTGASSDVKQQGQNDATRILNRFAWKGVQTSSTQANAWPRSGVYLDCRVLDSATIPSQILEAQYEITIALLKGYDPEKDMRNANVVSRGYSSVRVAYDPKTAMDFVRWGIPSAAAWNLILPFLDTETADTIHIHRVS